MHPRKLHFAAPKTLLVTGATVTLVLASASAAHAASLDTSATVSTNVSTPSVVSVGDNSFTISVTATGNLSSGQSGVATVTTKYFMAANGTITPSTAAADQQSLQFAAANYSQCPASNPPMGCSTNPFLVTADLVVAVGTPGGATGTVTVAGTGSPGLTADGTPATGYVKVAESNHAPTMPGVPSLDASSTTPNNTGTFTVDWAAATDPDTGDTVTYTLQKRDANDTGWTTVATGITTNSYSFVDEAEGSWTYQVQAVDDHGASSAFAEDGTPIVVVDKSAPNPPSESTDTSVAYNDGGTNWYKDSVTVSFTSAGDPALADGSAGSGVVDVTGSQIYNSTGPFSVTGHATDAATNESAGTTVAGSVDATAPTVTPNCPTTNVLLNDSTAAASWTASDVGSGLATAASGSVPLDTTSVGDHTVTIPVGTAVDNVGHPSDAVQCTYHVGYAFGGFLQPINDTAHFVGQSTSVFKAGSTVPVKFQLFDANGVPVQTATPPNWLTPAKGNAVSSFTSVDETVYSEAATLGSAFKWDASSQQYIYNYKTDKNQSGYYWRIGVKLDDGSIYYVSVALK